MNYMDGIILLQRKNSELFSKITSKNDGGFYCLNYLHSFRTENKLKEPKNVCRNHEYCYIETFEKSKNILKYNHEEKSLRSAFIIYADMESLLEKTNTCYNNSEKSSTSKMNQHKASGYSVFMHCLFDTTTKNKHNY